MDKRCTIAKARELVAVEAADPSFGVISPKSLLRKGFVTCESLCSPGIIWDPIPCLDSLFYFLFLLSCSIFLLRFLFCARRSFKLVKMFY